MLLAWLSQAGPTDVFPGDSWKSSGDLLSDTCHVPRGSADV